MFRKRDAISSGVRLRMECGDNLAVPAHMKVNRTNVESLITHTLFLDSFLVFRPWLFPCAKFKASVLFAPPVNT
jgi:hypothetical protein